MDYRIKYSSYTNKAFEEIKKFSANSDETARAFFEQFKKRWKIHVHGVLRDTKYTV